MTPSSFWKTIRKPASKAGTEGTVVYIQGDGKAYTVEFFDENGDTIEEALLKDYLPEQLKKK